MMENEIKQRAYELYTTTGYSLTVVSSLLKKEGKFVDIEMLKHWSKTEGWETQKAFNLQARTDDMNRIQVMKDIAYSLSLDGPTPAELAKIAQAYAALSKIVVPRSKGGEISPDDMLGQ